MEQILQLDNVILNWIAEHLHSPFGDAVMPWITALGNVGILWIVTAVILLFLPKWRKAGVQMLLALGVATLIGSAVLKPLIGRIRPFEANGFKDLLISAPKDFSFPSGHTAASFAAALVLFHRSRKLGAAAWITALLIAFSRLYLYVHYPTDVLAGAVLGCLSGAVGIWLGTFLWKTVFRQPQI